MRYAVVALALVLGCTACTGTTVSAPSPSPSAPPSATPAPTPSPTRSVVTTPRPTPSTTPSDCGEYAAPDPRRQVVTADVTVDGRDVTGTEHLVFTPDLPVTELVVRLWGAAPRPTAAGGSMRLTTAKVNGAPVPVRQDSATLVRLPYRGSAGGRVTIDLGFALRMPVGADDRFGNRGTTSWFASGLPLLAWERGRGWATEPATSAFAEASTSEEFRLERLTVHHAAGLSVLSTGSVVRETPTLTATTADAVRDVSVTVGRFRTVDLQGSVPVRVGAAPQVPDDPAVVGREVVRAMRAHVARFGPFPYARLVVSVLPDIGGGIEYPGAILLGTRQDRDATASHEVAHQWFYGLVGDDQARDPWLDEALATYAEALDRGTARRYLTTAIPADGRGRTGAPMTYWEGRRSYFRSVYVQGAAALLRARSLAPQAFDAQVRCYVARNAHRIATPADVRRSVPLAVKELRAAGALSGG